MHIVELVAKRGFVLAIGFGAFSGLVYKRQKANPSLGIQYDATITNYMKNLEKLGYVSLRQTRVEAPSK